MARFRLCEDYYSFSDYKRLWEGTIQCVTICKFIFQFLSVCGKITIQFLTIWKFLFQIGTFSNLYFLTEDYP